MRQMIPLALMASAMVACGSTDQPAKAETAAADTGASTDTGAMDGEEVAAKAAAAATPAEAIDAVLAAHIRDEDRARDQYRHPKETLTFFQVEPGMTVAEYAPGGGWYTRVLAPLVVGKGQYIGLGISPDNTSFSADRKARMAAFNTGFPIEAAKETGLPAEKLTSYTAMSAPADMKGKLDRILVIRMMHNLMRWGIAGSELDAMHGLLADDGLLGIVQHRAKADAPADYADGNHGYLKEADLIKFVEDHGFELVGKSEVNANPKDSADYPDGVWTLPPSLALKDKDREKYLAIGESDRMTLLFKKKG